MSQQQVFQLIAALIIFVFPAISWGIRKLQEQAALRRAELDRDRRRLEAMRTGRPAPAEPSGVPAPGQPRADLAQHRAAQLEELRRLQRTRQRSTSGQGAPVRATVAPAIPRPPAKAIPSFIPGSRPYLPGTRPPRTGAPPIRPQPLKPPSVNRPGPVARTAPDQAEYNVRRAKQEEKRAHQIEKAGRAERAEEARKAREDEEAVLPTAAALLQTHQAAAETRHAARASTSGGLTLSRDDWRRAILTREVLGPPLALRSSMGQGATPLGGLP